MKSARRVLLVVAAALLPGAARSAGLRALTLNVAGIPLLHSRLRQRLDAIAQSIRNGGFDVAGLQEVWRDSDARRLRQDSGLAFLARGGTALPLGTGLAILSRFNVVESHELIFSCRPSPTRRPEGEGVAGQGALMARLDTPSGPLDVYDTHLLADSGNSRFLTLRLTQVFELAEMIERYSAGRPFLLLGDLNIGADDPEFRALVDLLGLRDACVREGEDECGLTNEEEGRRLEHVLVPESARAVARAEAAFTEPIAGTNVPYSDHEGVWAQLSSSLWRGKAEPNAARRAEALARVETAIARMTAAIDVRRSARAWIPVYGFAVWLRDTQEIERLSDVAGRAQTARIQALQRRSGGARG